MAKKKTKKDPQLADIHRISNIYRRTLTLVNKYLAKNMLDENGAPIFTESDKEDKAKYEQLMSYLCRSNYKHYRKIADSLFTTYQNNLIENGHVCSAAEIERMDHIDATAIYQKIQTAGAEKCNAYSDEEKAEIMSDPKKLLFEIIPCFSSGILTTHKNHMVHFHVTDINLDENSVTIYLHEYLNDAFNKKNIISGDTCLCCYSIKPDETGELAVQIETTDETSSSEWYHMLSYAQLGWSKPQIKIWEQIWLQPTLIVDQKMTKSNISIKERLCHPFGAYILILNSYLAKYRVKKKPGPTQNLEPTFDNPDPAYTSVNPISSDKPMSDRIIHMVNDFVILSKQKPRKPSMKTVRQYTAATWTRRGHVRHYKSGKVCYIEPVVCKRQSLNPNSEQKPTPVTIRLKNTDPNKTNVEKT